MTAASNGQTTHLGGKAINLIGALSNIAEEALDGIGGLNVAMHALWKRVKRQEMLFILRSACGPLLGTAEHTWL